jgi:carbon-monoxide dehydrogenase small subunit
LTEHQVAFTLNGKRVEVAARPNSTLLEVLRYKLKLTGTKKGCGRGECGACTVLLDGKAVCSCLVLAPAVSNREVVTVEGLGTPRDLHPLQQAFIEHNAVHCGFCTPGMLMSAKALLDENANPTEEYVRAHISGNLCRCTGYVPIVEAILDVAKRTPRREKLQ